MRIISFAPWSCVSVLLGCLLACPAIACKYNVRDVGFSDIGSQPYHLILCVDGQTPEAFITAFEDLAYACLLESNIAFEVVKVHEVEAHPVLPLLERWQVTSFPRALLVAPSGPSLVLPDFPKDKPLREGLWAFIEGVVSSPVRADLPHQLVRSYGVVLLVQGPDEAANRGAEEACLAAIEEVRLGMDLLPKTIQDPPRLVTIPTEDWPQEEVLLWALDADEPQPTQPWVAVLYGRCRRMAQVLMGPDVSSGKVLDALSIIGLSCECGLDRSLMLGPMLPARWGAEAQSEAAEGLGLDVENPMVKMEMSQIMDVKPMAGSGDPLDSLASGYNEVVVDFDEAGAGTLSPSQLQGLAAPLPVVPFHEEDPGIRGRVIWTAIAASVLSVVLGLGVLFRARRRSA